MTVIVKQVTTRKELKTFALYDQQLYKGNPFFVPALQNDEINLLDEKKNPAFDFCEAAYFLAFRDGQTVGRIAAILNKRSNERWHENNVRFGFVDFIDDIEVSQALFEKVEQWARSKNADKIHGPLGFTDMDKEGLLIEGFDQLATMSALYNAPYYRTHIERLGYKKEVDWLEFKINVPEQVPEKHLRIARIAQEKYALRVLKYTSSSRIAREYGQAIFRLVNEAYTSLYGYVPLTQRQIDFYIRAYLPVLNLKFVTLIVDRNNDLIGLGIAMPSLSVALQKSGGKLFPLGFLHLLKALRGKTTKVVDLLLVAVKPEFQNKGVNALLFSDLIPQFIAAGVEYAESNPELEINGKVQAQWDYFETTNHKRRRAYSKTL